MEENLQVREVPQSSPVPTFIESKVAEAANRIQSAYLMAKRFPRNEEAAIARIHRECQRFELAEESLWSFPRAGQKLEGPTVRLMEVIAQAWGNLNFGVQELENVEGADGYSIIEGYCTDLETNNHTSKTFKVYHKLRLKNGGMKFLEDPRDVYEHVANMGARRMRSAIQAVIPRYVVDGAVDIVRKTIKLGPDGKSLKERIDLMVLKFSEVGVTVEMLERKLGHPVKETVADELVDLTAIYNTVKKEHGRRADIFSFKENPPVATGAARLRTKLNGGEEPTSDVDGGELTDQGDPL